MIIRFWILLLIGFSLNCNTKELKSKFLGPLSSENNETKNDTIYDVKGIPVLTDITVDPVSKKTTAHYYYILGDTILGSLVEGVKYLGGYKELSSFCDSLYYNRGEYSYNELNGSAYFTILFDDELKIKEVRILKRFAYDNIKYDYDNLIKEILYSTEGKWVKYDSDKKYNYYFYSGRFNLK